MTVTTNETARATGSMSADIEALREILPLFRSIIARPRRAHPVMRAITFRDGFARVFDFETEARSRVGIGDLHAAIVWDDFARGMAALPRKGSVEIVAENGRVIFGSVSTEALDLRDIPEGDTSSASLLAAFTGGQVEDLARVTLAARKDATLPVLQAVQVTVEQGVVTLAATDRYRLHWAESGNAIGSGSVLLHSGVLAHVVKIARKSALTVSANDMWARLEFGNVVVATRCDLGTFPRWQALIPTDFEAFTLDRKAAIEALKIAAKVAGSRPPRPAIVTSDVGALRVSIADVWDGPSVPADAPEGLRFGVNAAYLRDALESVTGDRVTVGYLDPRRPFTITGDSASRALVMPVRLAVVA